MSIDEKLGTKLEYVKPVCRALDLAAEEVMAIGCKLPTSSGSIVGQPTCSVFSPCLQTNNIS